MANGPACPLFCTNSQPEVNDYAVVSNNDHETTLKQLKRYGNRWVLHPLNPRYEDIVVKKKDDLRIIGVVVKREKQFKKR